MTNRQDFHEALYVYALDAERFDMVRRLLDVGFSPRITLARYADLTPNGAAIYDGLGRLFALLDDKAPAITVIPRRAACRDLASSKQHPKFATKSGGTRGVRGTPLCSTAPRRFEAL